MKFSKMQGIGNDYIYINAFEEKLEDPVNAAIYLSDRHFGVGGDGIIIIGPSDIADCKMEMYNADGSLGEMCGNGIRCVAKFVYEKGIAVKPEITVETGAGVKELELTIKEGKVAFVRVNMGTPVFSAPKIPVIFPKDVMINEPMEVLGKIYNVTCVSMGNPHCVVFLNDDIRKLDLQSIGPVFERHETFPKRVNTEFINIIDRNNIRMRVWERGSGETLACGTGSCASAVASYINGLTEASVDIELLGGRLHIDYDADYERVFLTGPAEFVFEGEVEIPGDYYKEDVKIY